jgi:hypothetical protein
MVRIEKEYVFERPKGKVSLLELFEARRQLGSQAFGSLPRALHMGWVELGILQRAAHSSRTVVPGSCALA